MKKEMLAVFGRHFNDPEQDLMRSAVSMLDPRFKSLKFLSSSERQGVYSRLKVMAE